MKEFLKKILVRSGYEVRRLRLEQFGRDPYEDMRRLAECPDSAVVFDVGANRGQSVAAFCAHFPSPIIHAFEPSPATFEHLKQQTVRIPNLYLNNFALGSNCERKTLIQNPQDTVSSLLEPGKDYSWGQPSDRVDVEVSSIDRYCESAQVTYIDVLKSDTQGFDHEVLKGAMDMLGRHRIHLIFIELNFLNLYRGMARFEEIYATLKILGFEPVSFYNMCWQDSRLGWMDGLFIDPKWERPSSGPNKPA